jgi:hypothetical protein
MIFRIVEEIRFSSLTKLLMSEALSLLPILHRLPRRLDRISAALEKGTLTTRTRLFSHAEETTFARSLASNLIQAFLSAALGIVGVLFVGMPGGGSQLIPGVSLRGTRLDLPVCWRGLDDARDQDLNGDKQSSRLQKKRNAV